LLYKRPGNGNCMETCFQKTNQTLFLEEDRFINSRPPSWYINWWHSCGWSCSCLT